MLEKNCQMIEQTTIKAGPDIYQYLLNAVTEEDMTYRYLKMIMKISCSPILIIIGEENSTGCWIKENFKKIGNHGTCQYGINGETNPETL